MSAPIINRCFAYAVMVLAAIGFRHASAATYEFGADAIDTTAGKLEIHHLDSSDPHQGKRITLVGKTIMESRRYLSVTAVYPDEPRASLVLLQAGTGGVVCPFFFVVLEIKDDHSFRFTDEFGNCDNLANPSFYKVKENPAYKDGVWHIALATPLPESVKERLRAQTKIIRSGGNIEVKRPTELPENLRGEVVLYEYRDGKIMQGGKPVTTAADDPEWEFRKKLENAVPDPKQRNTLIEKHGSVTAAYRAWLMDEATRKVRPEKFR